MLLILDTISIAQVTGRRRVKVFIAVVAERLLHLSKTSYGHNTVEAVLGDGSKGLFSYTELKRRLMPEGTEVD